MDISEKLTGRKHSAVADLRLESDSFADGAAIPERHAGRHGRSPSLRWTGVPAETEELVLLVEDPDAPMPQPFVHWVVYNIPPTVTELAEALPPTEVPLGEGIRQGRHTAGGEGYLGPMPPPGHGIHHYHFQLFALDRQLDLSAPVDRDQLVNAMRGHVLAQGEIVGTFERH
jgi:Raf kinase inhibitor-like YbhB/YbcL family protein